MILSRAKIFYIKSSKQKVFPEIFIQLLSSGFQSGSLLEMFEKLAFYFKDEIDNSDHHYYPLLSR